MHGGVSTSSDFSLSFKGAKAIDGGFYNPGTDLDAMLIRHPMAQGLLSVTEGLIWAVGWSVVALLGAYLLNPVCVAIFLAGCGLEIV